ncbi:MAG: hemin uptake protein HemP [Lysobacteraceae bacterium]|nr:MAG: hemin uptake protein HemP [Xanthomonadaceae bacterium]
MFDTTTPYTPTRDDHAPPAPRLETPSVDSRRLLGGARELLIRHGTEAYRLRLTRNDKLILTK